MRTPFEMMIPQPKGASLKEGRFDFGSRIAAYVPSDFPAECADMLKMLWHNFSMTASSLEVFPAAGLKNAILIGNDEKLTGDAGEYDYVLNVEPKRIEVRGNSCEALMRGYTTLLQLIRAQALKEGEETLYVRCCEIKDKPVFQFRGLHLCVFPETTLEYLQRTVRLAGLMKYNYIILEFWGMLRYDCLKELSWPQAYTKEQIAPIISEARALGMEIIPMFNHLGHATQSRVRFGRHVVLDQNPRLSTLFEPDGWTWCLSNPETLELLRNIRRELIELCGPGSYFHIGCDEAYSFATCDTCAQEEPLTLLTKHLNGLSEELKAEGRRAILWGDMLLDKTVWKAPIIACSRPDQQTHLILPDLSRELIIADWQYNITEGEVPSSAYFTEQGFDTLVCPWEGERNIHTCAAAVQNIPAFGLLATTWHTLPENISLLPHAAQAGWLGKEAPRGNAGEYMTSKMGEFMRKTMPQGDYRTFGWSIREVDY